jgi:sugar lactone lactonase YvrE
VGVLVFACFTGAAWGLYSGPTTVVKQPSGEEVSPAVREPVAVSAEGRFFALALEKSGTVMQWGERGGYPFPCCEVHPWGPEPALTGATAIAAGVNFGVALLANGTVKVWQQGNQFQWATENSTPTLVPGLHEATAISANGYVENNPSRSTAEGMALLKSGVVVRFHVQHTGATEAEEVKGVTEVPGPHTEGIAIAPIGLGLNQPDAVAVDSSGNTWVGDSANNRVLEYNAKREVIGQFGNEGAEPGQFKLMGGIATDGTNIYVADSGNHRVQEFNPAGEALHVWGSIGTGAGQFIDPTAIAAGGGNVWVSDLLGRVQEFSSAGTYEGQFTVPGWSFGLAVTPSGNLALAELGKQRVQEYSPSGAILLTFDEAGTGNGHSSSPAGIACDEAGSLFVTDRNGTVQKFNPDGSFAVRVASGLSQPEGLAVAKTGGRTALYVADRATNRLVGFSEWSELK